eukprot:TRINITY_DN8362_c1_g1_i1.p1 TRINITY_DN8362_c1_g1~~TRINITY_DN8362_c1_g1_i1.p1  ORF type:complete len:853 (+),score=281.94 TRINITY_DN8362_c1_g1_i1:87-2561(+)
MSHAQPPQPQPRGWAALSAPPARQSEARVSWREGRVMAYDGINATAAQRDSLPHSIPPLSPARLRGAESSQPHSPHSGGLALTADLSTPAPHRSAAATPPRPASAASGYLSRQGSTVDMPNGNSDPSPPGSYSASRMAQNSPSAVVPCPEPRGSRGGGGGGGGGGGAQEWLGAYGWSSLNERSGSASWQYASLPSASPQPAGSFDTGTVYVVERQRAQDSLGMNVDDDGLEIVKVEYGLPAHSAGVPVGGRLMEINGRRVCSVGEMRQAIRRAGTRVTLVVAGAHLSRRAAAAQGLIANSFAVGGVAGVESPQGSPEPSRRSSAVASPSVGSSAGRTPEPNFPSAFQRVTKAKYGGKDPWELLPDVCVAIPEGAESRYNDSAYRCWLQCVELPAKGSFPAIVTVHFVAEGDGLAALQPPELSRLTIAGRALDIHSLELDSADPMSAIAGRIFYTAPPYPATAGAAVTFTYGNGTYSTVRGKVATYTPPSKERLLTVRRAVGEPLGADFYDDNLEIMRVADDSPAAGAGIEPGMRLRRVNGKAVSKAAHVREQLEAHHGGDLLLLLDAWVRRPPPPLWVVPLRPVGLFPPPPSGSGLDARSSSARPPVWASTPPATPSPSPSPGQRMCSISRSAAGSMRTSVAPSPGELRLRNENERLRQALTAVQAARDGDRESERAVRGEAQRLREQLTMAQDRIRVDGVSLARASVGVHERGKDIARLRSEAVDREADLARAVEERDEQIQQLSAVIEKLTDRLAACGDTCAPPRLDDADEEGETAQLVPSERERDQESFLGSLRCRILHVGFAVLLACATAALLVLLVVSQ